MKTSLECFPCFIHQTLNALDMLNAEPQVREKVVREVLRYASQIDLLLPPPATGRVIHTLIQRECQTTDPYREAKERFNRLALSLYPDLVRKVKNSPYPLETAVRLAIAGNIIDFGIHTRLTMSQVHQSIQDALESPLDPAGFRLLDQAAQEADQILYLGDNAGEIVFDRLLIETLPREKITFVVKGSPIINDALREDAEFIGLTDRVPVIDNGANAPGTILELCSEEFVRRFQQADLIIAKGQGNFETLSDVPKRIFFLLKAKCPVVAKHIGCKINSMLLLDSSFLKGEKNCL
ncbi:MAG: ARMT1-like domain-containing protein [bacterium]|nr:ARMT1-like domain-containing protein [bacterium]